VRKFRTAEASPTCLSQILETMAAVGVAPSAESWTILLDAYGKEGRLQEAAAVLARMKAEGLSPGEVHSTIVPLGGPGLSARIYLGWRLHPAVLCLPPSSPMGISINADNMVLSRVGFDMGRGTHHAELVTWSNIFEGVGTSNTLPWRRIRRFLIT
jgi:pentatricopeptide repeat protein